MFYRLGMKPFLRPLFAASLLATAAASARPADIDTRVETMLKGLSLERKIDLIGGVDEMYTNAAPEIGLPRLKMSDGPLGVRTWGPSTAYAGGIALAATWDTGLAEEIGIRLGYDARARGVNFLLGPGVNIYRAPMNGRNFEYFGEDPFLAARIAVAYIQGVQSRGVVATVKHYAANNSEYARHSVNSVVDERTLHEIYFPAFEAAVKEAHVGAVMDSYNLVNGQHSTQNGFLNLEVLRKAWGFRGLIMSDWNATYDGVVAANSGLDLEMPNARSMNRKTLLPAIASGAVSEAAIDDKVRHLLRIALEFHFLDRDQLDPTIPLYSRHSDLRALRSAQESMVLLKNEGGLLPLDKAHLRSIAVIGPAAYPANPGGGGSSRVVPFESLSYLTGIADAADDRARVTYCKGFLPPAAGDAPGSFKIDPEAKTLAAMAEVAVVCVGYDPKVESEGSDRPFKLPPGQDELIQAIRAANPRTIVVLNAGGGVDTSAWIDRVPAFIHGFYGGQEAGRALAQVLFGEVNPSGRLPMSFERRIEDNPTYAHYYESPGSPDVAYKEGVFLGYRHYDRSAVKPLFPFGFGLSYTTFAFSHLSVSPAQSTPDGPVTVAFDVTNTGARSGAEVAQVYVGDPSAKVDRPLRELKGFQRVSLDPGQTKRVALTLGRRSFAYWDVVSHDWKVDPGAFAVYVGGSSADLPLRAALEIR